MNKAFVFTINKNISSVLKELKKHRVSLDPDAQCHLESVYVITETGKEELVQTSWIGSAEGNEFTVDADYSQDGSVSNSCTVIYTGDGASLVNEENIPEIINNAKHI